MVEIDVSFVVSFLDMLFNVPFNSTHSYHLQMPHETDIQKQCLREQKPSLEQDGTGKILTS